MLSKFANKSAQKSSIFSTKANFERSLLLSLLSLLVLSSCRTTERAYPIELPAIAIDKALQEARQDPLHR